MYGHERTLVEKFSGRPFVLLGVNNDGKISRVKKAIKDNNLNWRSWYDGSGGPIVKDFGITGFPTIFLIDHNGVIRYKNLRGARLDLALDNLVSIAEGDGMRGGSEPGPKLRDFVDMTGKYKTRAYYVNFENGAVVLNKEDQDKEIKVPWKKLSYDDRQFVAKERLKQAGRKKIASTNQEFSFEEPFTFTSGQHSIDATFIALEKGKVILWKQDGSEISVPWKKLSEESQDYVKKEIKRLKS